MKKYFILLLSFFSLFANEDTLVSYKYNNLEYITKIDTNSTLNGKYKVFANISPKIVDKKIEFNEMKLLRDKKVILQSNNKKSFFYELNSTTTKTPYFEFNYENFNNISTPTINYIFTLKDKNQTLKTIYSNENRKDLNLTWSLNLSKANYESKNKIYLLKRLLGFSFGENWQVTHMAFTDLIQRRFYQKITKDNILKIYVKNNKILNNILIGTSENSKRVEDKKDLQMNYFEKSSNLNFDIYTLDFEKFLNDFYKEKEEINLVELQLFIKDFQVGDIKKIEFLKVKKDKNINTKNYKVIKLKENRYKHKIDLSKLDKNYEISGIKINISNKSKNLIFIDISKVELFNIVNKKISTFLNSNNRLRFEKFSINFDKNLTQNLNLPISSEDLLVINLNKSDKDSTIELSGLNISLKDKKIKIPLSIFEDKVLSTLKINLNKEISGELSILSLKKKQNSLNENINYKIVKNIDLNQSTIFGSEIVDKNTTLLTIFTKDSKWSDNLKIDVPMDLKNINLKNISFDLNTPKFIDKELNIKLNINSEIYKLKLKDINNSILKPINFKGDLKNILLEIPTKTFYNQNYIKLTNLKIEYKYLNNNLKNIIEREPILILNSKKFFINQNFDERVLEYGGEFYLGTVDINSTKLNSNFNVSNFFEIDSIVLKPNFNISKDEFLNLLQIEDNKVVKEQKSSIFTKLFKLLIILIVIAILLKNRELLLNLIKLFFLYLKDIIEKSLLFMIKIVTLKKIIILDSKTKFFIFFIFYFILAIILYIKSILSNGVTIDNYYVNFAGIFIVIALSYLSIAIKEYLIKFNFGEKLYKSSGSIYFGWAILLLIFTAICVAIKIEEIAEQIAIIVYYLLIWGIFKEIINLKKETIE